MSVGGTFSVFFFVEDGTLFFFFFKMKTEKFYRTRIFDICIMHIYHQIAKMNSE